MTQEVAVARENWQDLEDQRRRARLRDDYGHADYSDDYAYDGRRRAGYRVEEEVRPRSDDFGQADYSTSYGYDADHRQGYRRYSADDPDYARRMNEGQPRRAEQPRSFMDRAGDFLSPRSHAGRPPNARRGPSDRVLWAVIMERLDDQRGLDLRDVRVMVEDAEVTLDGTVRHKADKRRVEDVADIDGIRHVQNNLRVRDRGHWTFL
jgi:hypothetical protein